MTQPRPLTTFALALALGAALGACCLPSAGLRAADAPQATTTPATKTQPKAEGGWRPLFNGRDLEGWRVYLKPGPPTNGWKVEDGLLKKVAGQPGGNLITLAKFDDFELCWDWRLTAKGNNGVKYLVTEQRPGAPGHEYQMLDDAGHPDGALGPKRQTASFYDVLPPAADKALKPVGEWNHSCVLVRGNHVEHWLNGRNVLEYELGSPALLAAIAASKFKDSPGFGTKIPGHIMLTDHEDECWFRDIRIREMPAR